MAFIVLSLVSALFIIGTGGCRSTFTSAYSKNALKVSEPVYELRAMRLPDSTLRVFLVGSPRLRTEDPYVRWMDMAIGLSPDQLNDTIPFNLEFKGVGGRESTVIMMADAKWSSPQAKTANRIYGAVSVVTASNHLIFDFVGDVDNASALELMPFAQALSNSQIAFGTTARRLFLPANEYLPTSESCRVLVYNSKRSIIWRSDAGMNFMQVVTKVEPQAYGETVNHTQIWNGRDMQGNPVPSQLLIIEVIIPARPQPYQTSMTYNWRGND